MHFNFNFILFFQVCVVSSCPNYIIPINAASSNCTNTSTITWGVICLATCQSGYTSSGSGYYCPSIGGSFTGNQVCNQNQCPNYRFPANSGSSNCTNNTSIIGGVICSAVCNTGYTSVGSTICPFLGVSFSSLQSCSINTCPSYPLPSNSVSGNCINLATINQGTNCIATCNSGYTSSGPGITCPSSGGAFTASQLCIQNTCPNYIIPNNAASSNCINGTSINEGVTCLATCALGYRSSGSGYTCPVSGGAFTGSQVCIQNICFGYQLPSNAISSNCTVGSIGGAVICVATCNTGYTSFGSTTCPASGGYFSSNQTCLPFTYTAWNTGCLYTSEIAPLVNIAVDNYGIVYNACAGSNSYITRYTTPSIGSNSWYTLTTIPWSVFLLALHNSIHGQEKH